MQDVCYKVGQTCLKWEAFNKDCSVVCMALYYIGFSKNYTCS